MSFDWYWLALLALAIPPAVGHLYHFVLLINFGSGLGFSESVMERIRALLFLALGSSAALLLWVHLREPWWTWSLPLSAYALACVVSGTLIAPYCSARITLRRRPKGVTGSFETHDLSEEDGAGALIGAGRGSWLLRLPRNESFRLHLREWDLALSNLPESLVGLQIVQLTDLHFSHCYGRAFFERVVERCASWPADLVVVTGDLIEADDAIAWIEPLLGRLEARLGKFAVLGNHDRDHDPGAIVAELARAGFETLEGRWTTIEVDGATLALGGTSAPWGPAFDRFDVPPADFRILLSHSPDLLYQAAAHWRIDFMLAGHNHGGQIRFPLVGPVFMPSRYSRRFDRGFFRKDGTLLYVSEGVGGKHPVRYGCPPEIARFVFRSAATSSGVRGLERDRAHGRKHQAMAGRLGPNAGDVPDCAEW